MADLLSVLDDIDPRKLSTTTHSGYVGEIVKVTRQYFIRDLANVLLFVETVKACPKPCYKRDLLLEVLNHIIIDSGVDLDFVKILSHAPYSIPSPDQRNIPWVEVANTIASFPDLVANCGALSKFPNFKPSIFYNKLAEQLYQTIVTLVHSRKNLELRHDHKLLLTQLLARLSTSSAKKALWTELTSKVLESNDTTLIRLFVDILNVPLSLDDEDSALFFEIYVESMYLPFFYYQEPIIDSGARLKLLLGTSILHHKVLQYLLCDKHILQTNYTHDKNQQHTLLYNIFAYLSGLVTESESNHSYMKSDHPQADIVANSVLLDTITRIAKSWSSKTKILARTYEHNRYISTAFVIAFKFAITYEKSNLIRASTQLQSSMLEGVQVYMLRAEGKLRNLAMCLGELLLPELHRLVMENVEEAKKRGSGSNEKVGNKHVNRDTDGLNLNFEVELNDDCQEIRRLFQADIGHMLAPEVVGESNQNHELHESHVSGSDPSTSGIIGDDMNIPKVQRQNQLGLHSSKKAATKFAQLVTDHLSDKISSSTGNNQRATSEEEKLVKGTQHIDQIVDFNKDQGEPDDDLKPYGILDDLMIDAAGAASSKCDDLNNVDETTDIASSMIDDQEVTMIPIYLSDCINGLVENNNPRYVKLCLMKAGELIHQLMEQEANDTRIKAMANVSKQQVQWLNPDTGLVVGSNGVSLNGSLMSSSTSPYVNDSIRDIACELAQLLLYLDDQFNIEGFNSYRLSALNLLCVSATDLVVKYLLDEFNASNRLNTRQQLEVLQVLVASAQQLSSFTPPPPLLAHQSYLSRLPITAIASSKATTSIDKTSNHHSNIAIAPAGDNDTIKPLAKGARGKAVGIGGKTNRFFEYASLYFYGIVHRLKADLNGAGFHPTTIVSAVRSFAQAPTNGDNRRESMIRRVISGLANSKSQLICLESPVYLRSPSSSISMSATTETENETFATTVCCDNKTLPALTTSTTTGKTKSDSSTRAPLTSSIPPAPSQQQGDGGGSPNDCDTTATSTRLPTPQQQQRQPIGQIEGRVEGDTLDDSYLLSRILFSTSLIIKCLNHQPITRKLSNDLLDILAAYKYHPDSGVRKAIVACLKAIRDHTPSVYFEECLHDKTINLFGSWLVTESEIITATNNS